MSVYDYVHIKREKDSIWEKLISLSTVDNIKNQKLELLWGKTGPGERGLTPDHVAHPVPPPKRASERQHNHITPDKCLARAQICVASL